MGGQHASPERQGAGAFMSMQRHGRMPGQQGLVLTQLGACAPAPAKSAQWSAPIQDVT